MTPSACCARRCPAWCTARGFDGSRLAAYGWSVGGYGSLRLAESNPDLLRTVAVLSPAIASGDSVFTDAASLDGSRAGVWCGHSDPFFDAVKELVRLIRPSSSCGVLEQRRTPARLLEPGDARSVLAHRARGSPASMIGAAERRSP